MEVNLKKKNTGLIAGIAAVVVVLAIILVMVFSGGSKNDPLQEQLDLGKKYMQEMNYEQAVAAYLAAIEIDDRCVEAYLGAAKAYEAMGDTDSAINILTEGFEKTGDSELETLLEEMTSAGGVYVVEFEDPDLTQMAQEFYQAIMDNPEDVGCYMNLAEFYLYTGEMNAAADVAKAGYNKTGDEIFKDMIEWAESEANATDDNDANTSGAENDVVVEEEPQLPETAKNQMLLGSEEKGYYRITFDEKYVEPRHDKVNAGGWIHFDLDRVQISVSLVYDTSFEDYFAKDKENFDWLIADNYITDLELGTPVQIQCGNVTAYYYEYNYIDISDKVVEPTPYQTQEFYVDFGDGTAFVGSTDEFMGGYYLYGKDGDEDRNITIEDYLRYVFVNVEKVE